MSEEGNALRFELHPAQLEVFQNPARFIALVAGRRFGKSYLAVVVAIVEAMNPANTQGKAVWIVAPVFQQAKQIYWQLLMKLAQPLIEHINVNEGMITLINGVQIAIKGSDRPDTLLGVGLWYVILDEFASMKAEVWERVLRPTLTDVRGRALFIGTPAGRNHFYELCVVAMREMKLENPDWAFFHFTSYDNPFLPEGEIDAAKATMSSRLFAQEHLAQFDAGGTGKIKREWVQYLDDYPLDGVDYLGRPKRRAGEWYLVLDLAGLKDGKTVDKSTLKRLDQSWLVLVYVMDNGHWFVDDAKWGRWGVKETAKNIVDFLADTKRPVTAWGMERGALYNAVVPYIQDEIARRKSYAGCHAACAELTHANTAKEQRIAWAIEGRFEHGTIKLRRGTWNKEAEDQLVNFPSRLVHDDFPDALSYTAQLTQMRTSQEHLDIMNSSYWQPDDDQLGF